MTWAPSQGKGQEWSLTWTVAEEVAVDALRRVGPVVDVVVVVVAVVVAVAVWPSEEQVWLMVGSRKELLSFSSAPAQLSRYRAGSCIGLSPILLPSLR